MRRTRLGQARALSSRLMFVLIALAFVGSGYLIGRYFLASLLQRTPKDGEPVITPPTGGPGNGTNAPITASIQLSPLTLYKVQIGAYSSRENADRIANAALQKGVGAAVMSPDPLYKVYCGMAGSKDAATRMSTSAEPKLKGSVVGKDDKLYVGSLSVDARSFSITGPKAQVEAIQNAYGTSDRALQSLLSFWDSKAMGETSQVTLSTMATDLATVKTNLGTLTPDTALKKSYDSAVAIVTALEDAVKAANESVGGDGVKTATAMASFMGSVDTLIQEAKRLSE